MAGEQVAGAHVVVGRQLAPARLRRVRMAIAVGAAGLAVVLAATPSLAAESLISRPLTVTVAADGHGDYTTVQAAIDAAPAALTSPYLIRIKPGTYRELVKVPSTKPYLTLVGLGRRAQDVVITYDNANGTPKPDGTGNYGTTGSASVTIDGPNFTARHLTFSNSFDEAAHPEISGKQAVAVLTRADRTVFDDVRFLGNQDTLYVNSSGATVVARAYFRNCYVEGDVDFIFGRGTAVFEGCEIRSLDRASTTNNGYVTAPSTDIGNPYGFLFIHSRLTGELAAGTVSLGRPWHPSNDPNAIGQVVFRDSWLGAHINPVAWSDFSGGWLWRDARFFEHHNRGPGAVANGPGPVVDDNRPQLTAEQAAQFTPRAYLAGADGWDPTRPHG